MVELPSDPTGLQVELPPASPHDRSRDSSTVSTCLGPRDSTACWNFQAVAKLASVIGVRQTSFEIGPAPLPFIRPNWSLLCPGGIQTCSVRPE
ncbi:hypothetical protein PGT21_035922 [Puccinia graminis f. sp. tritici]|uniref:Uncharacterized protein n=1 Tax=Puccinia graminis f. sp. tritici TaxID=56615 RepID=A0A5B0PBU2_PUCGR|nr:hypothetical protein PGT21_035922 [Puccinia graminis f. sp. tritici]KAA1100335.1 hypothetical protein PGTUg99_018607 [Puccinia graminis f. sp. tritici]